MQLIENMFSTGKRPPSTLLTALINTMLQSKETFKSREAQRTHWTQCRQAYTLLADVLALFGPSMYNPVWNEFSEFRIDCDAYQNEDMEDESSQYELLDTKQLAAYHDLWGYIDTTLNQANANLESKCRVLTLDLFVNVLQVDLKERLTDERKVARSVFFQTLTAGLTCVRFDRFLDILLRHYPQAESHRCQLAGSLLNMLITIGCTEGISDQEALASQLYCWFQRMTAEGCAQLMQAIQYPSFLIQLLDKALADTDISQVSRPYRKLRATPHRPLHLEKMLFYVLATVPNTDTLEALYRHVLIVTKYCLLVLSTASVGHQQCSNETNTALDRDQLILWIESYHQALEGWEESMECRLAAYSSEACLPIVEKIRWSIKLTRLTLSEYV
ncbi:hypothetical protein BY458DRAFT_514866 [Sporodiniella umbellata]|nr:hypothetical protein BY458DRAFT_514866 [Sporodiniella umbellata]